MQLKIILYLILALNLSLQADAKKDPMDLDGKDLTPTISKYIKKLSEDSMKSVVSITVGGRDGDEFSQGTGFVVKEDGLIATNLHVIGEARPIKVQFKNGQSYDVESIFATDRLYDLALLKIKAKKLPVLKLGNSDETEEGQSVLALGNPMGFRYSVVTGVISGLRHIEGVEKIQLAIPIEEGNSGGPVLNMKGEVVGLLTLKSLVTRNLGFAVKTNDLKALIMSPNPVPMNRWLTIGQLDKIDWEMKLGANWQQRAGKIMVSGTGKGYFGRSFIINKRKIPDLPYEIGSFVKLNDESGAAGLIFHAGANQKHYGFYPTRGKLRLTWFGGPDLYDWKILKDEQSPHYKSGEWNHLKVRIEKEGVIKCYINDHLIFDVVDKNAFKGKIGLTKFRHTKARFKHFKIAKEIANVSLDDEKRKKIEELIEKLPAFSEIKANNLSVLSDDPMAAQTVLEARAKRLQQEAEQAIKLSKDIHTNSICKKLKSILSQEEEKVDLFHCSMLIAKLDDPDVNIEHYQNEVKRMVFLIKEKIKDKKKVSEKDTLNALKEFLFNENGFHGSRADYYNAANSHMNRVIEDREGIPLSLSLLFMELAKGLGLNVEGVGLPGHFIVKYSSPKKEEIYLDVFDAAKELDEDGIKGIVFEYAGQFLRPEHLEVAAKSEIITRMLHNLFALAKQGEDDEAVLRYLNALITINPELVSERYMLSMVQFQTGRKQAAKQTVEWLIKNKPDEINATRTEKLLEYIEQNSKN